MSHRGGQIAARQQLHEQMGELQQRIQAQHEIEVVTAAEVFKFVTVFLLVEALVFDDPAQTSPII
jgi:transposase